MQKEIIPKASLASGNIGAGWELYDDGEVAFFDIPLDDVYEIRISFTVEYQNDNPYASPIGFSNPVLQLERDRRDPATNNRLDYAFVGGKMSVTTAMMYLKMPAIQVLWLLRKELRRLEEAPMQLDCMT